MPTSLSAVIGGSRRVTYSITSSDPSFAIPSWAQGGKGLVVVTGCGGGASGAVNNTAGARGNGGRSAAFAMRHPILIPASVSTLAIAIGAGGASVSAAAVAAANAGGNTTLTIGSRLLTLEGGGAEGNYFYYPRAYMGSTTTPRPRGLPQYSTGNPSNVNAPSGGMHSGASTLGFGSAISRGDIAEDGYGEGGFSLFGEPGGGATTALDVTVNGDSATGYGAGGAGALWISGANAVSGAGSPGVLFLEFVEGF